MTLKRSVTLTLVACCLLSSTGFAQSQASRARVSTSQPRETQPTDLVATDRSCELRGTCCSSDRLYFNGKCRREKFFERFLSTGATLIGVGGPRATDGAHDTGVVVAEDVGDGDLQLVFVLPDKLQAGDPMRRSYQYRADYPVVAILSRSLWVDSGGFLNSFAATSGPGLTGLGVKDWVHRAYTASGWCEIRSDLPGTLCAIASSSASQDYCKATAASDAAAFGLGCTLFAGGMAGASGIAVGTAAFVMSAGVGSIPAGTGTAIFVGGFGYAVCGNMANLLEATGVQDCLSAPPALATPTLGHYEVPEGVDVEELAEGECSSGFVEYHGQALYCPEGGGSTVEDDGSIVVTAPRCYNVQLDGECIPVSSV